VNGIGSSGKRVAGAGPSAHAVDDVNVIVSEVLTLHVIRLCKVFLSC
jgi:hypothetical protein